MRFKTALAYVIAALWVSAAFLNVYLGEYIMAITIYTALLGGYLARWLSVPEEGVEA